MDRKVTRTRDTVRKRRWIERVKLTFGYTDAHGGRWIGERFKLTQEMAKFYEDDFWISTRLSDALKLSDEGNPSVLAKYLKSAPRLSDNEKRYLGFAISGETRHGGGRSADLQVHFAAQAALFFYKLWRAENRRRGVRDRGLGDDMKDDAARIAVEDMNMKLPRKKRAAVRELMDRSKARCKSLPSEIRPNLLV